MKPLKLSTVVDISCGLSLNEVVTKPFEGSTEIPGLVMPGFLTDHKFITRADLASVPQAKYYFYKKRNIPALVKGSVLMATVKNKSVESSTPVSMLIEDGTNTSYPIHTIFILRPLPGFEHYMPYIFALLGEAQFMRQKYPHYGKVNYYTKGCMYELDIPDCGDTRLREIATLVNSFSSDYVSMKDAQVSLKKYLVSITG